MSTPTKFLLDESKMPTHWYNIAADLPTPAPPVLHPGTLQPVGPDDLAPLFPMELIMQEVSTEREIADSRAGARGLQAVAPVAADPRAPAGEGARHAGEDLLQVRRRVAGRLAQAQHRRAAGLVQRAGRHQEARHRDRRRPVGLVAGLRRRAVRHRGHGVPGARVVRPEALPPRADGNLRRALHRSARRTRPTPAAPSWPRTRTTRARWASRSPKRWKWRPRTTTPSTRSARC